VRFGLGDWLYYFREVAALPLGMEGSVDEVIENMIAQKFAVIGTPDDAIAQLENLQQQSGGFGAFLQLAHNWADFEATKKSYELVARHVAPRFRGSNRAREASLAFAGDGSAKFMGDAMAAATQMIQKHADEEAQKAKRRGAAAGS
jgi:limonene 1,2-monooxygenase